MNHFSGFKFQDRASSKLSPTFIILITEIVKLRLSSRNISRRLLDKFVIRAALTTMADSTEVLNNVKDYYGKVLQSTADLKTQACVTPGKALNKQVKSAMSEVHEEVTARYYGCGLIIPPGVQGARVLDLGSGSGRDCYALSRLVGQSGEVVGVDMTSEQIDVANQYIQYHTDKFGYDKPNVSFVQGYIEKLVEAGLQPNYFDIIVSNCVVNLSPDKKAVLSEGFKVLKPGGELYFSDVYSDTELSDEIRKDNVLWGECISGALHWKTLHSLAKEVGFTKPHLVSCSPINIDRDDFNKVLGGAKFCSATYRLFKLPEKHTKYSGGQVIYNGEIPGHEDTFQLDHKTELAAGDPVCLSGELVTVLRNSRLAEEFEFDPTAKEVCCLSVAEGEDPFSVIQDKEQRGEKVESACCGPSNKSGCC